MGKISCGRYTSEFRAEAINLITEGGLSSAEAASCLSLLENWIRASKAGKLGKIGGSPRPLTEDDMELMRAKRERDKAAVAGDGNI